MAKFCVAAALLIAIGLCAAVSPDELQTIHRGFISPPDDARIMMRWWWFGTAIEKPELERELRVMKDAGIGGVEIQPVYPLELDDPEKGFRNLPYLSDGYLDALRFTSEFVRQSGMRIDVTLGSGWPFGGPHTPVAHAAGALRVVRAAIQLGQSTPPVPAMENGEQLIRTVTQPGSVLFFISSRTGQQVKRAAVGAEGFVLDHYERAAIEQHLSVVGDRLMQAFGSHPPYSVFSDSLEVFQSDWTPNFLEEFKKRRGYDLTPYLPALAGDIGPETAAIRHDWGKTLTELAEENYLTPIREWAHAHHTLFRSQTYGEPPVILSSNALVDLPEGEHGPEWRGFSAARWASSASHLYGRPITSTETWTWLHSPAFAATPLDMKAEADLHFIEGINQLVGHGWPYSPPSAGEPGWRFYAAAAFNEHNPWFGVMPDIAKYLQRLSYLMRQGQPANQIAIYLPTDDAWAQFTLGSTSVDGSMDKLLGPNLIPQILNAGYNFDFIDDRAIEHAGVPYKLLILPGVERIPLSTLKNIQAYVRKGGAVIATRRLPSETPGLMEAKTDTGQIKRLAQQLLEKHFIEDEAALSSELPKLLTPDFAVANNAASSIGFVRRKLDQADIYFVVNASNQPVETDARVRCVRPAVEGWNPFTGAASAVPSRREHELRVLHLRLAPYESRVFVFHEGKAAEPVERERTNGESMDLSRDWKITFSRTRSSIQMPQLHSWADDPATRFYSGEVAYEKTISVLPEAFLKSTETVLDFGPGTPIQAKPQPSGMRALLDSPVRESGMVFVNGQRAGTVWHPPYELDVTKFLRAGENMFRIVVGNTALNEMAGHALPEYRLLNARYGKRFDPQGMEDLKPMPSGIVGPLRLVVRELNH